MSNSQLSLRQRINLATDYDRKLRESMAREWVSTLAGDALVLDAGSGDGHNRVLFDSHQYLGVDIRPSGDKDMVVQCDLHSLPLRSGCVDHVLSIEVFEHLEFPDRALGQLCDVLRPGGTMCISVPQGGGEHEQPHDFFRYTQFGLASLAERVGLEVVETRMRGGLFRRLSAELRDLPFMVLPEESSGGPLKSAVRLALVGVFTFGLCSLLVKLDRLDKKRVYTTGYIAIFRKPQ